MASAMVLDKMPKPGCAPDGVSYGILMKELCSKGKTDLALQQLSRMVKNGGESDDCELNAILYNTDIFVLCKEGKLAMAFGLYKQMHSEGVTPDIFTYINGARKYSY